MKNWVCCILTGRLHIHNFISVLYYDFKLTVFTQYCLGNYEAAVSDADKAIELAPQWGKGYARKGMFYYHCHPTFFFSFFSCHSLLNSGSALMLLQRYEEAHKALSSGYDYLFYLYDSIINSNPFVGLYMTPKTLKYWKGFLSVKLS